MYETNENTKRLLKKKIDEVVNKGDISPSEMSCIYEAYKTLGQIATIEAMDSYEDRYFDKFTGRPMHARTSYDGVRDTSMRRGRGADGRYVSRDGMNYPHEGSWNDGYSGHSIYDRMIASLEREMDSATSDYERQQIQEEIHSLRERQK